MLSTLKLTTKEAGTYLKCGWGECRGVPESGKSKPEREIPHTSEILAPLALLLDLPSDPRCTCRDGKGENLHGSAADGLSNKTDLPSNFSHHTPPFQTSKGRALAWARLVRTTHQHPPQAPRKRTGHRESDSGEAPVTPRCHCPPPPCRAD